MHPLGLDMDQSTLAFHISHFIQPPGHLLFLHKTSAVFNLDFNQLQETSGVPEVQVASKREISTITASIFDLSELVENDDGVNEDDDDGKKKDKMKSLG